MSKRTRVQPARSRHHQFHQPERLEDRLVMDGAGFVNTDPPEDPDSIVGEAGIVAHDDYIRSPRGAQSIRISPLLNDELPDGAEKLTIKSVSSTAQGATVTISDDGQHLIYISDGDDGFQGWDTLYYIVQTEDGLLGKANVRLGLKSEQTTSTPLPIRNTPNFKVLEDSGEQLLDVVGGFLNYPEYAGATITSVTMPEGGGSIRISDDGRGLWYQPQYGYSGSDNAKISVSVDDGSQYEFAVRITVQKPYRIRSAYDHVSFERGTSPFPLSPLGNDERLRSFAEPPYIESASVPEHAGTIAPTENGQAMTFLPATDFKGQVPVSYTVRYGEAEHQTVTGQLYVSVTDSFQAVENYFLIEPNSSAKELDVLANDPNYRERFGQTLRIVEVSAPSGGGMVTHNGSTISYQPAAGYQGDETFTYTVESSSGIRQSAQVTMEVAPRDSDTLGVPQFATERELEQYLIDRAVAYYGNTFGEFVQKYATLPAGAVYYSPVFYDFDTVSLTAADYSETNTQVEGVDEADIVETDGRYVYTLSDGKLTIVDLEHPRDPKLVSITELDTSINQMYLQGDRLTLLHNGSASNRYYFGSSYYAGEAKPDPGVVWVMDISDRTAPTVVERTELDGVIADSRAIGSKVHLVVQRAFAYPEIAGRWIVDPVPVELPAGHTGEPVQVLSRGTPGLWANETLEEYLGRVREQLVETGLPSFKTYNANGELLASGMLGSATELHKAIGGDDTVVSLLTIDTMDDISGPAAEATSFISDSQTVVYVSTESVYLFAYDYRSDTTTITKLELADDGSLPLVATGQIRGKLLNQFSADEYEGRLRVATTQQEREYFGDGQRWRQLRLFNNVQVIEQVGNQLSVVGEVTNLAPTETIKSVRFMGERAYVVTFRVVDPLFAIDLSDPTDPTVRGALKIPGFSDYLHPVGSQYLLGIGRDADEITGRLGAFQITLFDVSDLDNPKVADQVTFEAAKWVNSEAWFDHHAVSFFAEDGVLAVPLTWSESVTRQREDGSTYESYERHEATWTFRVKTHGDAQLKALGKIEHPQPEQRHTVYPTPIPIGTIDIDINIGRFWAPIVLATPRTMQRALRIDNVMVTVSNDWLEVHRLRNPNRQLGQLRLGPPVADDQFSIDEDSGTHILDVLANDPPTATGEPAIIVSVGDVVGGNVEIAEDGRSVRFTPEENYFGPASFTYTVDAPLHGEVTAHVSVSVAAVPDDPIALDDSYTLDVSAATTELDVLANDLNPDHRGGYWLDRWFTPLADAIYPVLLEGQGLTISEVSTSNHGASVEITDQGTIAYTPAAGYAGVDTFTYTISDNLGRTDTARVTVFVGIAPLPLFESPAAETVSQPSGHEMQAQRQTHQAAVQSLFARGVDRPTRNSSSSARQQRTLPAAAKPAPSWSVLVDAIYADRGHDDLAPTRRRPAAGKTAAIDPSHSLGLRSSLPDRVLESTLR